MAVITNDKFKILLPVFLILAVTVIFFYPSLKNDFVNWDDTQYVQDNLSIHRLTPGTIKKIFTSFYVGNYQPLVILSYAFDYRFFKFNPVAYHSVNLFLHLANCLFVFWFIRKLRGKIFVAFMTALFFGIHPLHVESVAWIAERKDVLYAFFYLGSMIAYVQYVVRGHRALDYYICFLLFILSCLSKSMAVSLPVALLVIDYYLAGKIQKKDLVHKIPFIAIAAIFIVIAFVSQQSQGAMRYAYKASLLERLGFIFPALAFYLAKMLYPVNLSCIYSYSNNSLSYLPHIFFFSPLLILALTAGVIYSGRYTRKIIFGSIFFVITIFPVLQVVPFGNVLAADRYFYVPAIGLFFICAEFFLWIHSKFARRTVTGTALFVIILSVLMILLGILTWQRTQVWKNSIVLFSDVLQKNATSIVAYNNRGTAYLERGERDMAMVDFNRALHSDQRSIYAYVNLCNANVVNGKCWEAIPFCEKAIALDAGNLLAYFNLANAYADLGQYDQAIEAYKKVISLNRNYAEAYHNLATVYVATKNDQEALALLHKAIELNPDFAEAHNTLAIVYFQQGKVALARQQCKMAMDLGYSPDEDFLRDLHASPP